MEFSSTESEESWQEDTQSSPGRKGGHTLILLCALAWRVHRALIRIEKTQFVEQTHASPYNMQVREREKSADALDVFCALRSAGVYARLVYSVKTDKDEEVSSAVEVAMGHNVLCDGMVHKKGVVVSIDSDGYVLNHTLYGPRAIAKALNHVLPHIANSTGRLSARDRKAAQALPETQKEALVHPLYRIESGRKRELIYPKGKGWVGETKEREKGGKPEEAASRARSTARRIYPISHVKKLVTAHEAAQRNMGVIKGERPYRVDRKKSKNREEETVQLYAPWQLEHLPMKQGCLVHAREIGPDEVYLVETDNVLFGEVEGGRVPEIGQRYSWETGTVERVSGGLLLRKEAYALHKERIKRAVASGLIRAHAEKHADELLNMQILSKRSQEYADILASIEEGRGG